MEQALLLNATYEPIRIIHWQKAITLFWQEKVEVLEVYDRRIRGVSTAIPLPAVLRLLKLARIDPTRRGVKFSRANIFIRDSYRCQYCGKRSRTEDLTFDHVLPIARGGKKNWENIVTACWTCNNHKSGRTPHEARMTLIKVPVKPSWNPALAMTIGLTHTPPVWKDYLYWNVELDHDD